MFSAAYQASTGAYGRSFKRWYRRSISIMPRMPRYDLGNTGRGGKSSMEVERQLGRNSHYVSDDGPRSREPQSEIMELLTKLVHGLLR